MRPSLRVKGLLVCLCLKFILIVLASSGSSTSSSLPRSSSIPRSSNRRRLSEQPPWNPSSKISDKGFLKGLYKRTPGDWEQDVRLRTFKTDLPVHIRQVPGDGSCLFHSISLCQRYAENRTHWDLSDCLEELYEHSRHLRAKAVACLRQSQRRLFLQGRESLKAHELVQAAAQQYGLTSEQYCEAMQQDSVWGGGPEIVALTSILKRPIHVYELAVDDIEKPKRFVLRRMACFGSPRFDRKEPLHILSADSRFPDLQPGQQLAAGNHFLAVFPYQRRKRRLRGGAEIDPYYDEDEEREDDISLSREDFLSPRWLHWWKQLVQLFVD